METRPLSTKIVDWLRRYGLAECGGVSCALLASFAVRRLTSNPVASAYAGAWGETIGYSAVIVGRDFFSATQRAHAKGGSLDVRGTSNVIARLIAEFGPAGLLDTFLVRPFMMGVGQRVFGPLRGLIAGKLAADVLFYFPVIFMYERQKRWSKG